MTNHHTGNQDAHFTFLFITNYSAVRQGEIGILEMPDILIFENYIYGR